MKLNLDIKFDFLRTAIFGFALLFNICVLANMPEKAELTDSIIKFQEIEKRALKRKTMYPNVLVNRLESEMGVELPDINLIKYLFSQIKKNNASNYKSIISKKIYPHKISNSQNALSENIIFETTIILIETFSIEDGISFLNANLTSANQRSDIIERILYDQFLKNKPLNTIELFLASKDFRKELSAEKLQNQIGIFCLSSRLTLQSAKCLSILDEYSDKTNKKWQDIEKASAFLSDGKILEVKNVLKKMGVKDEGLLCDEVVDVKYHQSYITLAAQFYRSQKNYPKSANCIDKMGSLNFVEKFMKNFETMKLRRLTKQSDYANYLKIAEDSIPKDGNYAFFTMLVDFERYKNAILYENLVLENSPKVLSVLKTAGFKDLEKVAYRIEKYAVKKMFEKDQSTFEQIDLSNLLESFTP